MILVLALLLTSLSVHAKTVLPIELYITRLQYLHTLIASNQLAAAKAEATALTDSEILVPGGSFHVDDSLLSAIAQTTTVDRVLLTRIELTIAELRGSTNAPHAAPDPKLLQQVAAEQDVPELARGGELEPPPIPKVPLMLRIARSIGDMFNWIWDKIVQFFDWLESFLPRRGDQPGATSGMRWIVNGAVALIVIGIIFLAVEVLRRSRRGAATLQSSAPLHSTRDDDPLSRGATEWERYAAQLAADGRFREAIRAWYHAVLVTCYGAGVLHFRKGRTNWEYIASLPPSTSWRPELIRLTQRFEKEWYGADQSNEDAYEDCSERAKLILDALYRGTSERGAA